MTKRMLLQGYFYNDPTTENLEALAEELGKAVMTHSMTLREAEYIIEKSQEYYDAVQMLQSNVDDL